jgi:import inner membrane translocase subunit TIM16
MAGPFARILAQFVIVAGGAVARSVVNAYKEAASRGASNPAAASVKQAISRRMSPDEAAKIIDIELQQCTREKLIERFETLYKANDASPYVQRKVSNARTVLMEKLLQVKKD